MCRYHPPSSEEGKAMCRYHLSSSEEGKAMSPRSSWLPDGASNDSLGRRHPAWRAPAPRPLRSHSLVREEVPLLRFQFPQARGDVPERAYVEALVTDLEIALPDVWGRRVYSIFFGGGTPSLFSAAAIEALISAFRARLSLAADCEITLEANPGTFEAEKFRGYREAGVNRLSIGIQSFNP